MEVLMALWDGEDFGKSGRNCCPFMVAFSKDQFDGPDCRHTKKSKYGSKMGQRHAVLFFFLLLLEIY